MWRSNKRLEPAAGRERMQPRRKVLESLIFQLAVICQ